MVDRGPALTVNYKLFDHYRYSPAYFGLLGSTYSQIIGPGGSLLLPGIIPASGVRLIVPPMQNRIVRIVFRCSLFASIANALNGNLAMPFDLPIKTFGNDGLSNNTINIDGSPIPPMVGLLDYLDIGPQVSSINIPSMSVFYTVSASQFDTTVFQEFAAAQGIIAGLFVDVYGYSPDMIPPTLI